MAILFQPLSTKINTYEIISKTYSNFYHFGFSASCIVSEKSLYNEETKGNATITKINVPMIIVKPYIKKALREDGESEEVIRLIKKIRKVKVYTVQNASDKMVAQFSRQSFGSNLQELMSVNSKDSKIKIMSAITDSDTMIKDLLIIVRDDKELVYIKVLGKFSLDDISRIAELSKKNKDTVANN